MRKRRLTDEQIVAILTEADRIPVAEAAKKPRVREPTRRVRRQHFAGPAPAAVKRLKALELETPGASAGSPSATSRSPCCAR